MALAKEFKAATDRALSQIEYWLSKEPIRHIKNRFPTETKYGCERYAYFDKYMITTASFLHATYLVCDESIPTEKQSDTKPCVWQSSYHFHKLFMKASGYGLEFDLDADPHYDANGLGRVHRAGAPSTICLSCPCPAAGASYTVDIEAPFSFSACSAVMRDGEWKLGADSDCTYEVLSTSEKSDGVSASLLCRFDTDTTVKESYTVDGSGVSVVLEGNGELGFALPAFYFDGERYVDISCDDSSLTVSYEGWLCRYTTDGTVIDLGRIAANRNGHYRAFLASGTDKLKIKIEILKA